MKPLSTKAADLISQLVGSAREDAFAGSRPPDDAGLIRTQFKRDRDALIMYVHELENAEREPFRPINLNGMTSEQIAATINGASYERAEELAKRCRKILVTSNVGLPAAARTGLRNVEDLCRSRMDQLVQRG